jgi:protein-tyrosine phosphatase
MDISPITPYLYVGAQPAAAHAADLCALNIGLIINMRAEFRPHAAFSAAPLKSLWLRTYDVFFLPIPVTTLVEGVRVALSVIEQGQAVLVHCQRGRHRSVALAAAILIAHGHSSAEAMRLLRQQRAVADPGIWYIKSQIVKFEKEWKGRD